MASFIPICPLSQLLVPTAGPQAAAGEAQDTVLINCSNLLPFLILKVNSCKGIMCPESFLTHPLVFSRLFNSLSYGGIEEKWGAICVLVLNFSLLSYKVLQFCNDPSNGFLHFLIQHPIL